MTSTKTPVKKATTKVVAEKKVAAKKVTDAPIVEQQNWVIHPIVSEKAVNLIDKENTLQFAVLPQANKTQLKAFLEGAYNMKIRHIRTLLDGKGQKKAFVTLNKEFNAREMATKMGVL